MDNKLSVAVIGCGNFANNFVNLFKEHPFVEKLGDENGYEKVQLTDVSDYVNTNKMVENKNTTEFKNDVANGKYQWSSTSAVQNKEIARLKSIELGGRPLICYYANFANGNNWMGKEDFLCDTDEMLKESVAKAKTMADDYDLLKEERFEFITNHKKIAEGVYCTEYSNGTKVHTDYNNETFEIIR